MACFAGFAARAQKPGKPAKGSVLKILHSNTLEFDERKIKRLIGDVQFQQDDVFLDCDSAYLYDAENMVEAYGRVHIHRTDSFSLYSDRLHYEGNTRKAKLTGNVHLIDHRMDLTTTDMDFDLAENIGYYTNGATILNEQNKLTSRFGYYYTKKNQVYFKKDVLLVNPEYTIDCDTMMYNSQSKVVYFIGPTHIKSADYTIYCENGWYDSQKQTSQFSRNTVLSSKDNIVMADSFFYNSKTAMGKGFRNIRVIDTAEKMMIRGGYGEIDRIHKKTFITRHAVAKKQTGDDSIYLFADTLYYMQAKDSTRILKAYYHARIFKPDLQTVSDSIVYSFSDSIITLYRNPVMWSEEKQLSADTIRLYMHSNKLDSMYMTGNAFIASKENEKHFNQIKGRNMKGYFQEQRLQKVFVFGNGQSVYYAKDSSGYIGINRIDCSYMQIKLDSNKLQKIIFYEKPEGTIYPVDQIPEPETRLKGFKWLGHLRPRFSPADLF